MDFYHFKWKVTHRTTAKVVPIVCVVMLLFVSACSSIGGGGTSAATPTPTHAKAQATATATLSPRADICPTLIGYPSTGVYCYTPHQFQVAYGVSSLLAKGYTGKGQTVVDIVSYGSPTLQQDMTAFDQQFGLPAANVQVISPLGTKPFDPNNKEMVGWASETTLDVQIIHALAPDAGIVVLTSPVDEVEGVSGLPQFLQLEQYAVSHHLGNVISQSWGASEVTLNNASGQSEIQQWNAFYKQATTQDGITFFASSGDNGATDYRDLQATQLSTTATTSFAPDDPWVTATGGTTLTRNGSTTSETAWNSSGGGFSRFFSEPSYQQLLPASDQSFLKGRRGVPDVSGDANPLTGLAIYEAGQWSLTGGTSAVAPLWSAIMAIADQMAGKGLGFINPTLYKIGTSSRYTQDFHDITVGNNTVQASGSQGVNVPGYSATAGWDPITGLGSPDAENLLPDLVAALK
jgi:subtilase family serine protease